MAALTRSGARKASEIVIFTLRTLHRSRSAMLSVAAVCSAISSSSHRRPRAIDATKVARLERRATTKNNENQSVCDRFPIVYLLYWNLLPRLGKLLNTRWNFELGDGESCISYTGTSYPDWVSS